MVKSIIPAAASLLMLATTAFGACNSYTACADKTIHWYDPTNGEVCDPLHCGGDRAGPLKRDIPCCPAYTGTEPCIITTSTLSCWSPSTAAPSTAASASAAENTSATTTTKSNATVDTGASSSTGTSSTGVAAETSSHTILGSTTAPSTTEPPTQSADSKTSETGSDNSSSSTPPVSTNIAASRVGPLMAVAGAAIGAVILV
ncbi:uncharacterized protein N7500_009137 [Penicillium coprophilum]|uniref:uncharacterized protein n=1 Tax=Penicillium coprophilum TaxID=36646 RepID=UPI002397422B|nr:uncharacterized protein N7500_009137 [Penicillium coprophilum]KAJ5153698.1 hypothetical protein N7500_009137 [Penicillium coprophilum]